MAGPLIWFGLNAKALTRDILIDNAFFNNLRMGNQFSHNSSTGIESGGILSINANPVLFNLSAGAGDFIDYTNPAVPTFKKITWSAFTAQPVTGLATQDETYILISPLGAIIQQSNYPTPNQRRTNIFIGRLGHSSRTTLQFATSFPDFTQSIASQAYDLFDALGPFNISGNQASSNGANMTFQKSTGSMFFRSFNYPADTYNPHIVTVASQVPVSFSYRTRNALVAGGPTTIILPANYDVGGVVTTVPGGVNVSTIQRVYLSPNGVVQVQYGQNTYPNLATATASIGTDSFIQNPALTNVSVLIAYIVVRKGATALNDPNDAAILRAPKFETGVGGGVNTVVSLQQAYNSSTQPQIVLSSLGGLQVFDNAAPIGGNLFQVANNAGSTNYLSVSATATTVAQLIDSGLTANTAVIANASKQLTSSTTTSTQLGFLSNVTSDIQTQINTKQGTNLIPDPGFESGTVSQWTLGTTGTLTNGIPTGTPTFGSGASANLTISAQPTGALLGTTSLQYQHVTNQTVQGNMMATNAITIQPEFQGKVLGVKFAYQTTVNPTNGNYSGTSSNSFGWALYDVTNSAYIGTAGQFNIVQNSGVGICTGTAQLPINTTSVRLVFYNVNATSATTGGGAITLLLDDFYFGPQTSANAPAMSDLDKTYTATITGSVTPGTITYTANTLRYGRVGDSIRVVGNIRVNTVSVTPGGNLYINLPPGLARDTSKEQDGGRNPWGTTNVNINGVQRTINWIGIVAPTTASIAFSDAVSGAMTITAGNEITVDFTVPIVGFSSNTVSSADTDTRVVGVNYNGQPSGTPNSTFATVTFPTLISDTTASYTAGTYTVPVSGFWDISAGIDINANYVAGGYAGVSIFVDGIEKFTNYAFAWATVTNELTPAVSIKAVKLNAGQLITIRARTSGSAANYANSAPTNFFSASRLSGPAVVQATSVVSFVGNKVSGSQALTANVTNISFDTLKDSNGSWATSIYTVPVYGDFYVSLNVGNVSGTAFNAGVYINGTLLSTILVALNTTTISGSILIPNLIAGTTIAIRSDNSLTLNASANTRLHIFRLGGTG